MNTNTGPGPHGGNGNMKSPSDILKPREVPPPPKRSKGAKGNMIVVLNFMMTCVVLATIALCIAAYVGKYWFEKPGPLRASTTLVIEEGSSVDRITSKLVNNGVIDNGLIFKAWVRAYQAQGSLKAGEYLFNARTSMFDVMETLRSGKGILHKVSVPEGLTVYQIFERLRNNEILEGEMPEELPAEGALMPDTYPFQRGTTRVEMVDRMKRAQEKFLDEVWNRRIDDLPISTKEELAILASIVEKETGRADERPRVASVFINRLRRGMKLQSDPTIIYGIFGGEGKPKDRPIYKSDIETATPYNTYTIPALPPGPIANPGRAALEAVANPSRTDDLFFVANGTGGHSFAKTLDEHNQNVARWRAIEAQQKKDAEAKAAEQD
ncbi:MAG: endolytic transglycosylase MltG [Rhizobiaceae bacterium]|nr:endolytic transglycosylase MltG [Rhizobiaceae bacterium]